MKTSSILAAAVASGVASVADAANAAEWRGRSVYQVLTDRFARTDGSTSYPCNTDDNNYCGGTWRGIANHLDYIKGMGFTAIWISPVTKQMSDRTYYGDPYHGFWQQDLYSLNDHFGTADDLKALSQALHDRDMYLMVDVVANHFGWQGDSNGVNYSNFYPFNDQKYFHSYCPISTYDDQSIVEECWLGDPNVELPDLRTEDQDVQDMYTQWISWLVSEYGIDGLRVDTAKHVGKAFWSAFQAAAGVYAMGEVFSGNPGYIGDYQNSLNGLFNYPIYYAMIPWLSSTTGDTSSLIYNNDQNKVYCKDTSLLGTFTENHDVPRFASYTQDFALAKNALAATILWDGLPMVYAGQEQHYAGYGDPGNREATWLAQYSTSSELYLFTAALNQVRNIALRKDLNYLTYNIYPLFTSPDTLALRKGFAPNQIISVVTNQGSAHSSWTLNVQNTGWSSGTQVVEVITCQQLTVNGDGSIDVPMNQGMPRIYFSVDAASGSGICGGSSKAKKSRDDGRKTERRKDQKLRKLDAA